MALMSTRGLDKLFQPRSVVVIGASDRPGSVGEAVYRNLLAGRFPGPIHAVNPARSEVAGRRALARIEDLPNAPDLAVICSPPQTVPETIDALGRRGTRAAVVITAGLEAAAESGGETLQQQSLRAAGRHGIRLLGPNCVGLIVPRLGLNASFAPAMAGDGQIAFITQSGALATTVLDWASERQIGFSSFVSMGNCLDVDLADVIDYFGGDPHTRSILLYMEAVGEGRKFMSAARAAARNKPMIVVKSGRVPEGAAAAASHTGAMAGSDAVFDAAIRRAGALRVDGIEDLFSAAELLSRPRPIRGSRLAILTNGGGPGILATDALILAGGRLAELAPDTLARLDACLPANWSRANPVDIIGDAGPDRYQAALAALGADPGVDAILILHAPTALTPTPALAAALAGPASGLKQPVLACWLGGAEARQAARIFAEAGLASFSSPREAITAFLRMLDYRANQQALTEIPPRLTGSQRPDRDAAAAVLAAAAGESRRWLSEVEAKDALAAYGIEVVATRRARSLDEAVAVAESIGFPVALKLLSPDITHKSDVGGVALDLESAEAVRAAGLGICRRMEALGDVRLEGFSVQAMLRRSGALELILGASTDPVFGPVMLFGHGGTAVEVIGDHALGLPPLNSSLARQQIMRTRVARLMQGYRQQPPVALDQLAATLVRLAELVTDFPLIESVDINPLLADQHGVVALDARIELRDPAAGPRPPPAIAPYPAELEERVIFADREILLRPIRPEDEQAHREFFHSLTDEDVRFRFFGVIRELPHDQLARYTQIDYDREMAFIAIETEGDCRTLGVVRAAFDRARERAEFAVVVRSSLKGQGLGRLLLTKLIGYAREAGAHELVGQVLDNNQRMLTLARELGFTIKPAIEGTHEVLLKLNPPPTSA